MPNKPQSSIGPSKLESALLKAAESAALLPSVPLAPAYAPKVAAAIAEAMPAPQAMEALWPQLARYAIAIGGSILVGRGLVTAADWEVIAGAALALAPPLWRTVSTWLARRKA
ncbi:hypothetical protein [Pararhodobacter sp.]|uniref:Pam3-gp28 family putative phage holin n=1 Tax=Pararhodobacter sp. TaxID=2127056 RepID=UPI002AFE1175|nr:hypothetical protein [Pararhodobacter sp.]